MNTIRKSNIAALALGVAVLFATNLLAKPAAQNYPEYPQNEGVPTLTTPTTLPPVAAVTPKPQPTETTKPQPAETGKKQTGKKQTAKAQTAEPVKPQPAEPVKPQPAEPVKPQPAAGTTYVSGACDDGCTVSNLFNSNLVKVEKILNQATGAINADVKYTVRTTAMANVSGVSLTESLPSGVAFVSAYPDVAKGSGNTFSWSYPQMQKGDVQEVVFTVRPTKEDLFVVNTKVCIDPAVCLSFPAGSPRLAITKTGPTSAELDEPVSFNITVTNTGKAPAEGVFITDDLPAGLRAGSGQTQTFNVGTLAPNQSRTFRVDATAAQPGRWVNTARADSSNADAVSAAAPVEVILSKIQITKSGPDRLYIHREAPYTITVSNLGTTVLNNVEIRDTLPKGTQLLSVSGGAPSAQQVKDNTVIWKIDALRPGESKTDTLSLTSTQPGVTVNTATVTTGKLSDSASARTEWEGPPGVLTEIVDDVDPIRVGSFVTYTITITNQGSFRDINTQVKVLFGDEIQPVECTAAGASINGKIVTLPDGFLKPNSKMTFKIKARAEQAGLHTTRLQFNSSFLPRPVDKDETTYVY